MLIYLFLLGLICLFGELFLTRRHIRNKKYFLICSFFCMALVLGLRGSNVGEDTQHYINVFEVISNLSWGEVLSSVNGVVWSKWGENVEYLFGLLNKIVSVLSGDGQVLLFVVAVITCTLFARFIYVNINKHVFLATLIFLCDSLYMSCFNGIRQMLAVAIVINAYDVVEKKQYKKAALIFLISFFVHRSSIIMLPVFMLFHTKDRKLTIIKTTIIIIAMFFMIPVLEKIVAVVIPQYAVYFQDNFWTNSYGGVVVIWMVQIAMSLYIIKTGVKNTSEYYGIIGSVFNIGMCLLSLRMFAFSRITVYFQPFNLMLFTSFIDRIQIKSRNMYRLAIIALIVLEFVSYARVPNRAYTFFWQ